VVGAVCRGPAPEDDKRSVTELEADEVGGSLKWATAKVERTSQRGNGEGRLGAADGPGHTGRRCWSTDLLPGGVQADDSAHLDVERERASTQTVNGRFWSPLRWGR
jgi:hypothetical protein